MSDDRLQVMTEEERERFHAARRQGGMCAACGRTLDAVEVVYREAFTIAIDGRRRTPAVGPVGAECASPELLRQVEGSEPERCAGCGRGVH